MSKKNNFLDYLQSALNKHEHKYTVTDVEFVIKGRIPKFNVEKEPFIDCRTHYNKMCIPERIDSILLVSQITEHCMCSICSKNIKRIYSTKDSSLDYKILEKYGFNKSNDWSKYPFERSDIEIIKKSTHFPNDPHISVLKDFQRVCKDKYGKNVSGIVLEKNDFRDLRIQN